MPEPANRSHQVDDNPVPGFRLVRFLGRGASGEVWEAIGPGGVRSALKIVYLSGALALKELSALRLVKSVQHPHLVPLFGYWLKDAAGNLVSDYNSQIPSGTGTMKVSGEQVLDGTLYVAMGMCDQDLMQRLKACQREGLTGIPVEELLGYMEEAGKALDYLNGQRGATRAGLQHCDIKPSNIMLLAGSVQVCDYGLVRVATDVRATKGAFGTVAYAAPECIREKDANASPHTDQYSLAVSYIELRTGKLPYDSSDFWAVLERVRSGRLTYPQELAPGELKVLQQALAIDPKNRFPNIGAFAKALRNSLEGGSSATAGRSSLRIGALIASVLIAGAALGGVWYYNQRRLLNDGSETVVEQSGSQNQPEKNKPAIDVAVPVKPPKQDPGAMTVPKSPTPAELAQPMIDEAQLHYDARRFDQCLAACVAALKIDPSSHTAIALRQRAWRQRGRERLEREEYTLAIEDFSAAHQQDPTDASVLTSRAEAYAAQQQWPDALRDLNAAILLHKNHDSFTQRGIAYLSLADLPANK